MKKKLLVIVLAAAVVMTATSGCRRAEEPKTTTATIFCPDGSKITTGITKYYYHAPVVMLDCVNGTTYITGAENVLIEEGTK